MLPAHVLATALNSLGFAKRHDPSFQKACLSKTVSNIQSILKSNSKLLSSNVAALKTAAVASTTKPPDSLPEGLRGVLRKSHFPCNT